MHTLDYPVFDADNHYYEALDAFTRHLDPALGPRVIEWAEVNGRRYHSVGGRINHAVTNPTFNPISPAGALFDYFRGNPNGVPMHELMGKPEPIRPEYRDRDARLAVMDAQGIAQVWLFPTLGMLYEEALHDDPEAVVLLFRAFNRWLAEDWGMAYRDRIFAAPYITLADVDEAVRELEWALDQDARSVVLRAAAPITAVRPALTGGRRVRPLLGPGERGRHHRRRPRRRRRAVVERIRRGRLRRHLQVRAVAAEHQDVRH